MLLDSVFPWLSEQVAYILELAMAIVAAVPTTWLAFKWFARKWIEDQFAKNLENHRHTLQKDLEDKRFELNRLMDRKTRHNQQEYEILPELWQLMVYALEITKTRTSPVQSYPDFNNWPIEEIREWLDEQGVTGAAKDRILNSADRMELLINHLQWEQYSEAKKAQVDFSLYLAKKSVLIPPEILKEMQELEKLISDALFELHWRLTEDPPYRRENQQKLFSESSSLRDALEAKVREYLRT